MHIESVLNYLSRSNKTGASITIEEIKSLNEKLNGLIPVWYQEILERSLIVGVELGCKTLPPEEGFDGIEEVTILDKNLLRECNLESYPGKLLWPLGYFTFGYGSTWAGNCFVFNPEEGEDPPVYEVWHDAGRNIEELKVAFKDKRGVKLVSKSFSSFFDNATF